MEAQYIGQYIAVATANGVECWIAEEGSAFWIFWKPVACQPDPGDEVQEAKSSWGINQGILHMLGRTERFQSGKIATGADTATLYYGKPYALPPGYMANRSELWVADGSSQMPCGRARYTFNSITSYLLTLCHRQLSSLCRPRLTAVLIPHGDDADLAGGKLLGRRSRTPGSSTSTAAPATAWPGHPARQRPRRAFQISLDSSALGRVQWIYLTLA